jgi:hypothetical protein
MRRTLILATLMLPLPLGCAEDAVVAPERSRPAASILDARHGNGNAHFYFLPPLVPSPNATGTFDATLSPTVRICEWSGAACAQVLATFTTSSGPGSETVRLDASAEEYVANWHTDQFSLDPAKTYRIAVLVAGTELGHADVDVVQNGAQLRNVQTGEYVGLVNGRTLPIKFRIEVGAVRVVGPAGATVSAPGGTATLEIPPGALAGDAGITVQPSSAVPPRVTAVPGTAWSFGPDGLRFEVPVTLTIRYSPAALGAIAEHKLRLHKIRGGGLVEVEGSTVDTVANEVRGEITGFSDYVVGPGGGLTWSLFPGAPTRVTGLAGLGNGDLLAVTARGEVWSYNGAAWSRDTVLGNYVHAVWAADPVNVFVIGRDSLFRYDGSQWAPVYAQSLEDFTVDFTAAIWGTSASNVYVSYGTAIHRFDGSSWSQVFDGDTTCYINRIWGSGPADIFAVGDCVVHYDGSNWVRQPWPVVPFVGWAVWGSGPSDVYAVGYDILHYDGIAWSPVAWPGFGDMGGDLRAIAGSSSVDVYVLDDWGYVSLLRYNGTSWLWEFNDPLTRLIDLEFTSQRPGAIWVTSRDTVWVAGVEGILRGVR